MYLIFKLIFIYSLCYNVELLPEECIADYLLLSKNVKTDSLAKHIQTEDDNNEWEVMRGISKNEAIKYQIDYKDLQNFMGKEYANRCFEDNENLKLTEKGLILDIKKLFSEEKTHLILSKNIEDLLDKQSTCLYNFLNKNFDKKYITTKLAPQITHLEDRVKNFEFSYRIMHNSKEYVCYWNLESSEILNEEYIIGTEKFNQLEECNNILTYTKNAFIPFLKKKKHQKFCYKSIGGLKYINTKQIFKHFNINQFYLKLQNNVIQVEPESECSICLEEFNVGEKAMQLHCKHIFHKKCIEPWLKKSQTCPICRNELIPNLPNMS